MEKKKWEKILWIQKTRLHRRAIQKVLAVSVVWFGSLIKQLDFFQGEEWLTAEEAELMMVEKF